MFALGILLIDLLTPAEWKWLNAVVALAGLGFAAWATYYRVQLPLDRSHSPGALIWLNSMVIDRFSLYFFYLFIAAAGIAILISVRYLEIEHENHGEYYALILFSVIGMMCMAAGVD